MQNKFVRLDNAKTRRLEDNKLARVIKYTKKKYNLAPNYFLKKNKTTHSNVNEKNDQSHEEANVGNIKTINKKIIRPEKYYENISKGSNPQSDQVKGESRKVELSSSFHHMGKRKMQNNFALMNNDFNGISVNQSSMDRNFNDMFQNFRNLNQDSNIEYGLEANSRRDTQTNRRETEKRGTYNVLKNLSRTAEDSGRGAGPAQKQSKPMLRKVARNSFEPKYQMWGESALESRREASFDPKIESARLDMQPRTNRPKSRNETLNSGTSVTSNRKGNMFQTYSKVKKRKVDIFDEYDTSQIKRMLNETDLTTSGVNITLLRRDSYRSGERALEKKGGSGITPVTGSSEPKLINSK